TLASILALSAFACSSSTNVAAPGGDKTAADAGTTTPPEPDIDASSTDQNETWSDGKVIDGSVSIASGVTVTIAPGAKITIAAGASIVVKGTLSTSSSGSHAVLGDGNAKWGGIVVASGGTLALDGVDLKKAGVRVQGGNADAKLTNASIDGVATSAGV